MPYTRLASNATSMRIIYPVHEMAEFASKVGIKSVSCIHLPSEFSITGSSYNLP